MQLAAHYYRPDFTPAQAAQMISDMVGDLDEFTLAEIEVAIRAYRINPANKFFPRSADLRELILGERKHRRAMGDGKERSPEFGEGRPFGWEYQRKRFWKPHWRVDDLNSANDPERRARYDRWLALVKAGAVEGKNANEY